MTTKPMAIQTEIRRTLDAWADATREGRKDDVLKNHAQDVLIYDVLPPMKYEGTRAYRKSWGEWQPETPTGGKFELEDIAITANSDIAFATGFIRCGGSMPDGRTFEDLVRATFCLQNISGSWTVVHQHISQPFELRGA